MDRQEINALSPQEREAFHRDAEARIQTFSYSRPPDIPRPKQIESVCRGEYFRLLVQVVKDGGENNLHYHTNSESAWMVLKGRARFYGVGDRLLGDFGPQEGVFLPGGSRYRFEKVGEEVLEILQMVAGDTAASRQGQKAERVNIDAHKDWMGKDANLTVYADSGAAE